MLNNKTQSKKGIIILFALILFSLVLATNTYAAQDFIVENRTSTLFIVNGTTGNIIMAPSFGIIGINTTRHVQTLTLLGSLNVTSQPTSKLEVAGTFNATSSSTQFLVNTNGNVVINLKG